MKIVVIGGRDIHLIGGIESYMYNLASTLVRFDIIRSYFVRATEI